MSSNNDAVNESLSALLDNEHSELDLRRVLKASGDNDAVAETYALYQLQGQILRKELPVVCSSDFMNNVRSAIDSEETYSGVADDTAKPENHAARPHRIWYGYLGGYLRGYAGKAAIAASFAFVFLLGANQLKQPMEHSETVAKASSVSERHESVALVPSGFELPQLNGRTVSSDPTSSYKPYSASRTNRDRTARPRYQSRPVLSPELQKHVDHLLMQHAANSAVDGGFGILPLTRVGENAINGAEKGTSGEHK